MKICWVVIRLQNFKCSLLLILYNIRRRQGLLKSDRYKNCYLSPYSGFKILIFAIHVYQTLLEIILTEKLQTNEMPWFHCLVNDVIFS